MELLIFIGITLGTFFLMEGVTWTTHRYIMHGILWMLHKDHHQKQPGVFEKNDLFFIIFAVPSFLLILFGTINGKYWMQAIGFGIMAYGAAYFLVHDVIIHQRFKWFTRTSNPYIKRLRRAHKMHHKHLDKHHGESFGMLWVNKRYKDKPLEGLKSS